MDNNNKDEIGCLSTIAKIVIIFIGLVFFCGTLDVSSEFTELIGYSFVISVFVIVPIYYIIKKITNKIEIRKEEKEQFRVDCLTKDIKRIERLYTPDTNMVYQTPTRYVVEDCYTNKEILHTVKQYKTDLRISIEKCNIIDAKIKEILVCKGLLTLEEKRNYLTSMENELKNLKQASDAIKEKILKTKIVLLNEDSGIISTIKDTFEYVKSSKKCVIETTDIQNQLRQDRPKELDLFEYKHEPVMIYVFDFYYCFFSNVILVFDSNGIFSTALDPTAIKVVVEKSQEVLRIIDNDLPFHKFIDDDSKCISTGETRRTWLHTRIDGSPDLRYSYNPRTEIRWDTYEYGVITIEMQNHKILISISSEKALSAVIELCEKYLRKCNDLHNPIPELLQLLEVVLDCDDQSISHITNIYETISKDDNYFCTVSECI